MIFSQSSVFVNLNIILALQNFQNYDSSRNLPSLEGISEIISSKRDELDFFYETRALNFILKLLRTDIKPVEVYLKILLDASKRNEKFRKQLLKNNIFDLLTNHLKGETDYTRNNFVLYTSLIVVLVHGNADAQNRMRTSGCLSYLMHILFTFLVDVEIKPLPYKNTELIVYSIIASNKNPRHLENQTEIGWITPKIVEYLGKQTIFSGRDQIQVVKCFWSLLKTILHKNENNQQIFLKCSGFVVLFRSLQEIVDERKNDEFVDLLIKMTGVLIMLRSQKEFLHHASSYCSLTIILSLLNTCNIWIIEHVIIFLDSLTQEIPYALQPITQKQILQCLMKAKNILSRSKVAAELSQSIFNRSIISSDIEKCTSNADKGFTSSVYKIDTSELNYLKDQFCPVHDTDESPKSQFHLDYFIHSHECIEPSQCSKLGTHQANVSTVLLRSSQKRKKAPKFRKINCKGDRKGLSMTGVTIRRIIQFFGKLWNHELHKFPELNKNNPSY